MSISKLNLRYMYDMHNYRADINVTKQLNLRYTYYMH